MTEKMFYNSAIISKDIIEKFDCGNQRLNKFFIEEATETETCGLGNTTFFYDPDLKYILGFFTVSLRTIDIKDYKKYNNFNIFFINDFVNRFRLTKFPVLEIMRFAVDESSQCKRVGTAMMKELYKDIIDFRLKYNLPVNSIYIESLYDATYFYKSLGFEFMTFTDDDFKAESYPMMINVNKIAEILYS